MSRSVSPEESPLITQPPDLPTPAVAEALRDGWGVAEPLRYEPVGFGSHHWVAGDDAWFVTVDDLDVKPWLGDDRDTTFDGLCDALRTAIALRDAGLDFVVAPVSPPRRLGDRYAVALYEFVGGTGDVGPADARRMVAALHDATPPPHVPPHDVAEPARAVRAILGDPLLASHTASLERFLGKFDALVPESPELVVTHGEPKPGNLVATPDGPRLVDWDTVALAPRERDLWFVPDAGGDPDLLTLYRMRWTLADIASFVQHIRIGAPDAETMARYLALNLDSLDC